MQFSSLIIIGDHCARVDEILPEIPVYMSDTGKKILETVFRFAKNKDSVVTRDTIDLHDGVPVTIKDMTITPYTVDHSAYDSFLFKIDIEDKKILFACDYRNHSYKGKLLPKTLHKIGKVDLLITEGTTLSREQVKSQTEAELANEIAMKTNSYKQVLCLMSTTNVDRVTTLTRVANRTGKVFIHDILLDNVLQLCTPKIPNRTKQ